jgi:fucose permease
MLLIYLVGCIVTTVGVLVACTELPGMRGARRLSIAQLTTAAGALWPVLVVGVLMLIGVVVLVESTRGWSSRRWSDALAVDLEPASPPM